MMVAKIAVDQTVYHFDKPFDYSVPSDLAGQVRPGCRVLVPFGSGNRKRQGMVLALETAEVPPEKIKPVSAVLDREPLLTEEMLKLAQWVRDTTFCTLYDAVRLMLPVGINYQVVSAYGVSAGLSPDTLDALPDGAKQLVRGLQGLAPLTAEGISRKLGLSVEEKTLEALCKKGILTVRQDAVRRMGDASVRMVRLTEEWEPACQGKITAKQKSVVSLLSDVGSASVKELCYFLGITPAVVQALVKKNVCAYFENEVYRGPYHSAPPAPDTAPLTLTGEQQAAYDALTNQLREGGGTSLLFGVTGSGKTAVFLKLIQQVVAGGRDVIVMVPEISLTPQLIDVFRRRFGGDVAVFHSGLSMGERMDEWKRVKSRKAHIAVGTRSAVFALFAQLGLIVMDEEQEYTYKSESAPRFHARDIARFRCGYHRALLLLSSATPSVETFYAARKGKYTINRLTARYGGAVLPEVEVVDMNAELRGGNTGVYSAALAACLERNLAEKKQSILLLNRRGYHTFASCKACGTVLVCPHCSISMTYHAANGRLMCHYCGYSMAMPRECPACRQKEIKYAGLGTQRAEEELRELFPQARILRMDTDTTMARFSHETKLGQFAGGEYDIMIGTQMVAKGLDFPNVTLVGVLSADQSLYSDDYRGYERAFSLLTQVVGRSGRGGCAGRAVIQTMTPENPIIQLAADQDYDSFFQDEIALRRARLYPPFADLCMVGFVGLDQALTIRGTKQFLKMLTDLASSAYPELPLRVIGPSEAAVLKVSNKYRYKLMIKCRNGRPFRAMLSKLLTEFGGLREFSKVTVYADMNPDNIL